MSTDKLRGRPKKKRNIQKEPLVRQFSPRGRIGRPGSVNLTLDEYEALRLVDFLGYNQKEAAQSMGISQQTLSRTLKSARKAVAEGVTLGLIINIEGPTRTQKIHHKQTYTNISTFKKKGVYYGEAC